MQIIKKVWDNYKYRFVPWISLQINEDKNVGKSSVSSVGASVDNKQHTVISVHHMRKDEDSSIADGEKIQLVLENLFKNFLGSSGALTAKAEQETSHGYVRDYNAGVMERLLGFSVERSKSTLGEGAGSGVFIRRGRVKSGSLVALYPGTIYLQSDPLFFASIKNQFIFRCKDGILIDGNDRGLSKSIYKSCAVRDQFSYEIPCCDQTWLTPWSASPLNVGQYINNENSSNPHNVVYQEVSIRIPGIFERIPPRLWRYLPNIWYDPSNNDFGLRLVPLIAVRDIEVDEELFSAYFTVVHG